MRIEDISFSLIDVGASGGVQKKWERYKSLHFYGFEPDSRDLSPLKNRDNQTWFNIGVYTTPGQYSFYLLKEQCNSSLLEPNLELIEQLAYDAEDFSLLKKIDVYCDNLDNICHGNRIDPDIVKLDTQGTEYEILSHSSQILTNSVFCAEIEVEFLSLYKNQKLFADVDMLMRRNGFILMDLGNQLYMRGRHSQKFNVRKGFFVAADALYFKNPDALLRHPESIPTKKWLAILPICQAYGYLNYAYELFSRLKLDAPNVYQKVCEERGDVLALIEQNIPPLKKLKLSERKYAKIRNFLEKRIKIKKGNWNYGLGNPAD